MADKITASVLPRDKIKKTKRSAVLKLEFGNDTHSQLDKVATALYGLEAQPTKAAKDNNAWTKTDQELFAVAKASYDGVLAPFLEDPRVYKFNSTKEKVWEDLLNTLRRLEEEKAAAKDATRRRKPEGAAEKKKAARRPKKKAEDDEEKPPNMDQQLATYLDPFDLPKPWREDKGKDGVIRYFNSETYQKVDMKPGEVYGYDFTDRVFF